MEAGNSQRRASAAHRRRRAEQGLVRLEVQAAVSDGPLIRALAETLRGESERADAVRAKLREALGPSEAQSAFGIFGSELPDDVFENVFEASRDRVWPDRGL